jgi:hypothetical protein
VEGMTYFVRVNGDTLHNNPNIPSLYVLDEPPLYPYTYFNALNYCLHNNMVRIGWPDTGDLTKPHKTGALAQGYTARDCKIHHQDYLRTFANISVGSTIVMPDKDHSGDVYLGRVTQPYHYFHDVPVAPYEYAHRLGVEWLRDKNNQPIRFLAHELGMATKGGFWLRAFAVLDELPTGRAAIPLITQKMKSAFA